MKLKLGSSVVLVGILAAACGGGGGGAASFDLLYAGPSGSGLAGGQVDGVRYLPVVLEDLVLAQGIDVTGRVTDGAGLPLDNASVVFHARTTPAAMDEDSSNASGDYALRVPAGSWTAEVDSGSDALGRMTVHGCAVSAPGPATFDFQFTARVPVTGSVFEELGPAIAGAELEFTGRVSGARVTVTCDGAGAYDALLVPDTYDVVVTPAGPALLTHLEQRFPSIVVSGGSVRDFELSAGVQVSGTVRTSGGLPLTEDTKIKILLPASSPFSAPDSVTTDPADGSFSIGPVPTGSVTFQLTPPGDSGYPRQQVARSIAGPATQSEDFTLRAGFVLSGTIVRDDGLTPEQDVDVEPLPTNGSLAPDDEKTDGSGTYAISLFAGTYEVQLTPDVANLQLPEERTLTVVADTVLDVTLTRGALLEGTVTQPGGLVPEPDVRVEIVGVRGATAVTDGSGQYSFLAPAGTHSLSLVAEGGSLEGFALAPVAGVVVGLPGPVTRDIELTFATSGSTVVTGTVFEPDWVTPAVGAEIMAFDASGNVIGRALSVVGGTYVLVIP